MTDCQWIGKILTSGRLSLCFLVWLHTIKVVNTRVSALALRRKKLKVLYHARTIAGRKDTSLRICVGVVACFNCTGGSIYSLVSMDSFILCLKSPLQVRRIRVYVSEGPENCAVFSGQLSIWNLPCIAV